MGPTRQWKHPSGRGRDAKDYKGPIKDQRDRSASRTSMQRGLFNALIIAKRSGDWTAVLDLRRLNNNITINNKFKWNLIVTLYRCCKEVPGHIRLQRSLPTYPCMCGFQTFLPFLLPQPSFPILALQDNNKVIPGQVQGPQSRSGECTIAPLAKRATWCLHNHSPYQHGQEEGSRDNSGGPILAKEAFVFRLDTYICCSTMDTAHQYEPPFTGTHTALSYSMVAVDNLEIGVSQRYCENNATFQEASCKMYT